MITVTIPIPPRSLHPNARPHHMQKHREKAAYRRTVCLTALEAIGGRSRSPLYVSANTLATFYLHSSRRRDNDNLAAWLKTAWDGLKDAGIFIDDDKLTHLPPKTVACMSKNQRVVVEVWT